MNRRSFLGGLGALGLGGAFGFAAQNDDQRIANLEATVTSLDGRVGTIEALWGKPVPMTDPTPPPLEPSEETPVASPAASSPEDGDLEDRGINGQDF